MVNPKCDVYSSAVPYYMLAYRIYKVLDCEPLPLLGRQEFASNIDLK